MCLVVKSVWGAKQMYKNYFPPGVDLQSRVNTWPLYHFIKCSYILLCHNNVIISFALAALPGWSRARQGALHARTRGLLQNWGLQDIYSAQEWKEEEGRWVHHLLWGCYPLANSQISIEVCKDRANNVLVDAQLSIQYFKKDRSWFDEIFCEL
jgi:hypothetical protein